MTREKHETFPTACPCRSHRAGKAVVGLILLMLNAWPHFPARRERTGINSRREMPGGNTPRPTAREEPEYEIQQLSTREGLSQNSVFAVWRDRHGFMWFGTRDGANRFDGYAFSVFPRRDSTPAALSALTVNAVLEDRRGNFWFGTLNQGLICCDAQGGVKSVHAQVAGDPETLADNEVTCLAEDDALGIWAGTLKGLGRLDPHTGRFQRVDSGPEAVKVIHLSRDSRGRLWAVNARGLVRCNPMRGTVEKRFDLEAVLGGPVFCAGPGQGDRIWICAANGRYCAFDTATGAVGGVCRVVCASPSGSPPFITAIAEDQQGALWVGIYHYGLVKLLPAKLNDCSLEQALLGFEQIGSVKLIHPDPSGLVWVGTTAAGAFKIAVRKAAFHALRYRPDKPDSLWYNDVRGLCQTRDGVLWVGTQLGGLNRIDGKTGQYRHYLPSPKAGSIQSNSVYWIYEDSRAALWLGTSVGLLKMDRSTDTFSRIADSRNNRGDLTPVNVRAVLEDRQGMLWVGSLGDGLYRLDPTGGRFQAYRHDGARADSLSSNQVYALCLDQRGTLWVGTNGGGLNRMGEDGTFHRYNHREGDPGTLSSDRVLCIHPGRKRDCLWVGTYGGGLNRFDHRRGRFKSYSTKDGLPNDVVYGILEDRQGNLWLSTNKGLSVFAAETESFCNFDQEDGLPGNEFNGGSYFENAKGEFFFGGNNGLSCFVPEEIRRNWQPPPLAVSVFHNSCKVLEATSSAPSPEPVVLDYPSGLLTLEFAALDFTNSRKNQYMYRVEGVTPGWVNCGTRRVVSFPHLEPGEYRFRIKGSNNDGVWSTRDIGLQIIVHPPFWQTWWFRLTAAAGTLALGFVLHRVRLVRMRNLSLKRQVEEKTTELVEAHARMVDMAYQAGRGDIAAGMIHNIGNVLTGVKVPLQLTERTLAESRVLGLAGISALLAENERDLERFFCSDDKGKQVIPYLAGVSAALLEERQGCRENLARATGMVSHIEDILLSHHRYVTDMKLEGTVVLSEIVEEASTILQDLLTGTEIMKRYEGETRVTGNRSGVLQVVINLLKNAGEAVAGVCAPPRTIRIRVAAEAEFGLLEIADNGVGIPPEAMGKLFTPRFTTKPAGRGLGLHTSALLIQGMGGELTAFSEGAGKGAVFSLLLPIQLPATPPAESREDEP